jgi:hypothetical protein
VIRTSTLERISQDENPAITSRFENMEKFIQRILHTQGEQQSQINSIPKLAQPHPSYAAAPSMENPQAMPLINSLRYDMDNIKNDIFLHKQKSEDYFKKHESLEKKVHNLEDGVALQKFGKAIADISAQNFMATNFSKLGIPENSSSSQAMDPFTQEYAPKSINPENHVISSNNQRVSSQIAMPNMYSLGQTQATVKPQQVSPPQIKPGHGQMNPKGAPTYSSAGTGHYEMRGSLNGDEFDRALDNMSMIDKQMDQSMDVFDDIFGTNTAKGTFNSNQAQPSGNILIATPKPTFAPSSLMPIIEEAARTDEDISHQGSTTKPIENFHNPTTVSPMPVPAPIKIGYKPNQDPTTEPVPSAAYQPAPATPLKKLTGDESNTSLLNQSLNSSIRIPKKALKEVDRFIVPGLASAIELPRTSFIGQESPIQNNPTDGVQLQQPAQPTRDEDDESILELNMDEEGYLLDEQGQRILNDLGQPIMLSDEQIEALKINGMYEEVETSVMK